MSEDLRKIYIEQPDGSTWAVPVMAIARNRAAHYAYEFGGSIDKSLCEDTLPLFKDDTYEIEDWAANNMNWIDVKDIAERTLKPEPPSAADFQEAWVNGNKEVR